MTLVVLADAQERVGDSVTQDLIDSVEDWLITQIGPLTGPRTETFYLSDRRDHRDVDGLWLSRRTDSVTLTNDGDALTLNTDYRLINRLLIERVELGEAWGDTIVATYAPHDEEILREVLYDLLTYRTVNPNLQSIRIGAYSETFATGGANPVVNAALSRVLPAARLGRYASPYRYRIHRADRSHVQVI